MWSYERGGGGGGGDGARRNVNLCKLITTAAAIATTVLARGKPILTECERGRDGGDRERESIREWRSRQLFLSNAGPGR